MKGKYSWSENQSDEIWYHDRFDTIEECIRDAVDNYKKKVGDQIAVGICEDYVPHVDVDILLDRAGEDAYEECGEAAENWPAFISRKGYADADKLQEKIDKVFNEWLEETHQVPGFYHIKPLADMVTIPGGEGQ
jgi:predicted urease superfamily metal-dependent hydrolase